MLNFIFGFVLGFAIAVGVSMHVIAKQDAVRARREKQIKRIVRGRT